MNKQTKKIPDLLIGLITTEILIFIICFIYGIMFISYGIQQRFFFKFIHGFILSVNAIISFFVIRNFIFKRKVLKVFYCVNLIISIIYVTLFNIFTDPSNYVILTFEVLKTKFTSNPFNYIIWFPLTVFYLVIYIRSTKIESYLNNNLDIRKYKENIILRLSFVFWLVPIIRHIFNILKTLKYIF